MNKRQLGYLIDRLTEFDDGLVGESISKDSKLRKAIVIVNNELVARHELARHPKRSRCPKKQSR